MVLLNFYGPLGGLFVFFESILGFLLVGLGHSVFFTFNPKVCVVLGSCIKKGCCRGDGVCMPASCGHTCLSVLSVSFSVLPGPV